MSLTDERCSGQQWVELSAFQNNAVTVLRVVRYSAKLIETVFNIILFDRFKINFQAQSIRESAFFSIWYKMFKSADCLSGNASNFSSKQTLRSIEAFRVYFRNSHPTQQAEKQVHRQYVKSRSALSQLAKSKLAFSQLLQSHLQKVSWSKTTRPKVSWPTLNRSADTISAIGCVSRRFCKFRKC